ncbi:DUF4129 domain-containing protein [Labrys wisconsinensis]|uniref:Protein-glutamine gamma-glutamyltransferase-like C-terminal domain-containing protein n=1 Tax=Labrys wisconsinensis TaxID=425677 RepID=A0ABU0J9I7_9HYPH|nr:DUF4129 domain-containing protein [Labrys wisconsinensis]MDQ0470930.1 hypothetical protein [Labrys wisconsinensis]
MPEGRARRRWLAGPAALLWLAAGNAWAADPEAVARAVARSLDLQTSLPKPAPPDAPDPFGFSWHIPPDVARLILWGAVIIGAALIVWSMRDSLPGFSRSRSLKADAAAPPPRDAAVERMDEAQLEADALYRQGRIAEAMHVLLLQGLAEMRRRLNVSFAASLTSREILRHVRLPEAGRAGFADLVQRVERAYFGSHAVAAEDYQACRRSFEALTGALASAGPA